MPGHVFPLSRVMARADPHRQPRPRSNRPSGRTLSRRRHLRDHERRRHDGAAARSGEFAAAARLKVGTIADLIAYRRKHDHFVKRIKEIDFESRNGGPFKLVVYLNTIETRSMVRCEATFPVQSPRSCACTPTISSTIRWPPMGRAIPR